MQVAASHSSPLHASEALAAARDAAALAEDTHPELRVRVLVESCRVALRLDCKVYLIVLGCALECAMPVQDSDRGGSGSPIVGMIAEGLKVDAHAITCVRAGLASQCLSGPDR